MIKTTLPVLIVLVLALTGCEDKNEEKTSSRYSTNTFTVVGGTAVITQITDHQENKTYYYKLRDKDGLTLQYTVDLTKCGSPNIPFEDTGDGFSQQ